MKLIQVFDPPMCCSTGVCGPDIDPTLPRFAGWLAELERSGVKVERYNLAHQPLAFVQNPAVKSLLDTDGMTALPALFLDGRLALKGAYPTAEQSAAWLNEIASPSATTP